MTARIFPIPAVLCYVTDPQATVAYEPAILTPVDVGTIHKRIFGSFLSHSNFVSHGSDNCHDKLFNILH